MLRTGPHGPTPTVWRSHRSQYTRQWKSSEMVQFDKKHQTYYYWSVLTTDAFRHCTISEILSLFFTAWEAVTSTCHSVLNFRWNLKLKSHARFPVYVLTVLYFWWMRVRYVSCLTLPAWHAQQSLCNGWVSVCRTHRSTAAMATGGQIHRLTIADAVLQESAANAGSIGSQRRRFNMDWTCNLCFHLVQFPRY